MNRFGSSLLWILALVAAVGVFTGCSDEDGTLDEDEHSAVTEVAAGKEQAAKPAAAPQEGSATLGATAPAIEKLGEKEKADLAEAGHALPTPPPQRPRLSDRESVVAKQIAGVELSVPKTWAETPAEQLGAMRVAEFNIPAAEGAQGGAELVAFSFGPGQGGSVMANIERWLGQVKPDENTRPLIYQQKVHDLTVTEVYATGTLLPSSMGSGPTEPQPGSALYGIIAEGAPQGTLFLKITGDQKTIEAAEPALATLIDSMQVGQQKD